MKIVDVIKALRQRIGFFFLFNMTEDANVQKIEMAEMQKVNDQLVAKIMELEKRLVAKDI